MPVLSGPAASSLILHVILHGALTCLHFRRFRLPPLSPRHSLSVNFIIPFTPSSAMSCSFPNTGITSL
ncbi:hypothetical protein J6590_056487 [Homalodisca vitripennis]|nr:hypothetical protein J6590_056487 [Homalodisca vitripennis]